jgi:hypothetical protein
VRRNERRGGGPRRGGVATRATSSRSSPSPGRGSRPAARPCPPPLAVVPHERRRGRPRWQPPRPLLRITPRPLTRTFGCDLFSSRFRSHYRRVRRWRAGGGSSGEGRGSRRSRSFLDEQSYQSAGLPPSRFSSCSLFDDSKGSRGGRCPLRQQKSAMAHQVRSTPLSDQKRRWQIPDDLRVPS